MAMIVSFKLFGQPFRMTREMTLRRFAHYPFMAASLLFLCFLCPACRLDSTAIKSRTSKKNAHKSEVAPIPTPPDILERMLEMAGVTADDVVYDLGSGDGRIVIAAAKKYGCKAVGYEIEPELVKQAQENVRAAGVGDLVTIEERDIFSLDLSGASVVTMYLLPHLNKQLVPQLEQLKPGSRVVTHDSGIAGYEPDEFVRIESTEDQALHKIYLWRMPLKRTIDDQRR
jgi:SAM-dependent methyltransferase